MMEFTPEAQARILKKLAFRSSTRPHPRTCKSRISYAVAVLNSILKNINKDSVHFAMAVLKSLKIYLADTSAPRIDQFILKLCNSYFVPELFQMVVHREIPDIAVAAALVQYKHSGIIDKEALKLLHLASFSIQEKARAVLPSTPETEKKDSAEPDTECSKNFIWNDFSEYEKEEWRALKRGISAIQKNELRTAKSLLFKELQKLSGRRKAYLYDLLALLHFLRLEYQESMYYILKGLESGVKVAYFHECMFFIERRAGIQGPTPRLTIHGGMSSNQIFSSIFENKYALSSIMGGTPYRNILYFNDFIDEQAFMALGRRISTSLTEYTVILLYAYNDKLFMYDMNEVVELAINWTQVENEFAEIMAENRAVLSMIVESEEDKRSWWHRRITLDKRLGRLIESVQKALPRRKWRSVILILDERTIGFPFDVIFNCPVRRVPSLEMLLGKLCVAPKNGFYLLDAASNLDRTRECIANFFNELDSPYELNGVVGRELAPHERAIIEEKDLFMYFGHGTGRRYVSISGSLPRLLFLFGCSSGRLVTLRNYKPNGPILAHLKQSRSVLGMLWDVTDKDIDRFSVKFLESFFKGTDSARALAEHRRVCKLKYLNGAAPVLYGIGNMDSTTL